MYFNLCNFYFIKNWHNEHTSQYFILINWSTFNHSFCFLLQNMSNYALAHFCNCHSFFKEVNERDFQELFAKRYQRDGPFFPFPNTDILILHLKA